MTAIQRTPHSTTARRRNTPLLECPPLDFQMRGTPIKPFVLFSGVHSRTSYTTCFTPLPSDMRVWVMSGVRAVLLRLGSVGRNRSTSRHNLSGEPLNTLPIFDCGGWPRAGLLLTAMSAYSTTDPPANSRILPHTTTATCYLLTTFMAVEYIVVNIIEHGLSPRVLAFQRPQRH